MSACNDDFCKALATYLGYGVSIYPDESLERLRVEFGDNLSAELVGNVGAVLQEMKSLRPNWSDHSLASAGAWAKEEIRFSHPELSPRALDALEWSFTWWWK